MLCNAEMLLKCWFVVYYAYCHTPIAASTHRTFAFDSRGASRICFLKKVGFYQLVRNDGRCALAMCNPTKKVTLNQFFFF